MAISSGRAQDCRLSVSGTIQNTQTDEALGAATILARKSGQFLTGAVADEQGRFTLEGLCPNSVYTLEAKYVGYRKKEITITTTETDLSVPIKLEPYGIIDLVEVLGWHEHSNTNPSHPSLGREGIEAQAGKTLGETLEQLPGVALLRTGPTIVKPMIHGLQGQRILILNQGVRHEGQQWGNDHAPEIDPLASGSVEIIKGSAAVRYGADALGGVVLARPLEIPQAPGFGGRINLAGASNNGMGAGSVLLHYRPSAVPSLGVQATGTYRRAGDSRSPDYVLSNTGLREWNAGYRLTLEKKRYSLEFSYNRFATKLGVLYSSHSGNITDLQNALSRNRPKEVYPFTYRIRNPYQEASHETVKAKGTYYIREDRYIQIQAARQFNKRYEYDRHKQYGVENYLNVPAVVFNLETRSIEALYHQQVTENFFFEGGLSYYYGIKTGNFDATTQRFLLRSLIPNYNSSLVSAWAVLKKTRGTYLYSLGMRGDLKHYTVQQGAWPGEPSNRNFTNPTVTVELTRPVLGVLFPEVSLSYSGRTPSIAELYSRGLHHGLASIEIGTPNLQNERMLSASVGAELRLAKLALSTQWYANRFFQFINLIPSPPGALTVAGYFPVYRYVPQDVMMMGSDWQARYLITKNLSISGTASLVRARQVGSGTFVQQIPSDRYRFEVQYQKKGLSMSVNTQLVNKQWRLPGNLVSDTLDFALPPRGYMLMGMVVSWKGKVGKLEPTLALEANNLLNTRYRDYLDRFRYFSDSQGRNVLLRLTVPFSFNKTDNQTPNIQ